MSWFQHSRAVFGIAATLSWASAAQTLAQPAAPDYARYALSHSGQASLGQSIFNDEQRAGCVKCHTVDGTGAKTGPDLSAVGAKFPKADLIRAILEPSASIAVGYATTRITTTSGEEIDGILKSASADGAELALADGKRVRISAREIASQRVSEVSLMPEGLCQALSPAEFSHLIAYLLSLRPSTGGGDAPHGFLTRVPRAAAEAVFKPLFPDNIRFRNPSWFGEVPGQPGRFLVLETAGRVWTVETSGASATQTPLLDLTGAVHLGGGSGLLAGVFHPRFPENRKYYLKYQQRRDGHISTLLVERQFTPDFRADAGLARTLLEIPCLTQDHTGGGLEFGPEGLLYLGMGDSGPQRDPQGHGQDLGLLLGKILRLNVDAAENGAAYSIPADNPFRQRPGARPEIWAWGFREPWRLSFDRETHDLWVGDVGQDRIEEVDIARAGENFGWNVFEGFDRFSESFRRASEHYQPPIFAYPHSLGVSITGGYVYRGREAAALRGSYICADFESRRVWALTQTNRSLSGIVEIATAPSRPVSFAQGRDGELYVVGFDSGAIYCLDLSPVDPAPLQIQFLTPTSEQSGVVWRMTLQQPDDHWPAPDFDDRAWTNALGGFGTAGTPGAVIGSEWRTDHIWLRREFTLPGDFAARAGRRLALRLHHDEDAEIYLNGREISRQPRWTSGYIEVPLDAEAVRALRPGRNVIALHCRQTTGGQYIDAGLLEYLRGDSATNPP